MTTRHRRHARQGGAAAVTVALGAVLATANPASGLETRACEQGLTRGGAAATGSVTLSRVQGSSLLPPSRGEAAFKLLGNRRLRFTRTDTLVAADTLPLELELALEANDATLAAGDWCTGIADLVTRPLAGRVLAQLLGIPAGGGPTVRPRLVLRPPGSGSALLAGTPAEITFTRRGCGRVCAPALTAACRSACETQQPRRRCIRQCRRAGLGACRTEGSCSMPTSEAARIDRAMTYIRGHNQNVALVGLSETYRGVEDTRVAPAGPYPVLPYLLVGVRDSAGYRGYASSDTGDIPSSSAARVASSTKSFTAALIPQLDQEGTLSIDDNTCCRACGTARCASSARPPNMIVGAASTSPASSTGCSSAVCSPRSPARAAGASPTSGTPS